MKQFKRWVTALVLAASLGSAAAPVRNAQAGLLLLPAAGVGVFLIIIGALTDDTFLVILDNAGVPTGDGVERMLEQKYQFIGDRAVIGDLASAIRTQAASARPDARGRREIRLERTRIFQILEPTGLTETSPTQVERLISDLS